MLKEDGSVEKKVERRARVECRKERCGIRVFAVNIITILLHTDPRTRHASWVQEKKKNAWLGLLDEPRSKRCSCIRHKSCLPSRFLCRDEMLQLVGQENNSCTPINPVFRPASCVETRCFNLLIKRTIGVRPSTRSFVPLHVLRDAATCLIKRKIGVRASMIFIVSQTQQIGIRTQLCSVHPLNFLYPTAGINLAKRPHESIPTSPTNFEMSRIRNRWQQSAMRIGRTAQACLAEFLLIDKVQSLCPVDRNVLASGTLMALHVNRDMSPSPLNDVPP